MPFKSDTLYSSGKVCYCCLPHALFAIAELFLKEKICEKINC